MLLPADSYIVINKSIITELDKKVLIDLYQPIVGNKAISFYFTLLNDLEKNGFMTDVLLHHHLLSVMQISLEDIVISREKLEAVGLVKTYYKKGDSASNYIYVLFSPLSPNEVLNHPILNIVLYNNIGKKEYERIVSSYKVPRVSLKDYDEITSSFDQVFGSVPTSGFFTNDDLVGRNKNELRFKEEVDFELLIEGLKSNIINEKAFNKDVRYLINNLSYLYNIDMVTMQGLIKSNITEKGMIDKDALRKSARSFYQFENKGNLPTLIYSKQPEHLKSPTGGTSKRAMMIYTFENTNPYQFIKSKYKDGKVITRDLQLIESLLLDIKLSPGVVNVLLDYVLRVNNQKLNKNYVETIASSWKRMGIETVDEAMNACIKEFKKVSKKDSKDSVIKVKDKGIVPEWFNQNIEKQEISKEKEEELKNILSNFS